jgi:hypothetical protein
MTILRYLVRQQLIGWAVGLPAMTLAIAIAVWAQNRLDPRWGRLEVYVVFGVVVYSGIRLLGRRLLKCPKCGSDLSRRTQEIWLKKLRTCPKCGISFDASMPRLPIT